MSIYHQPRSLKDALAQLSALPQLTVLAGATDFYPARTARAAWGARETTDILDISGITSLRGIEDRGNHWWIGAMTTWADIVLADLPPLFDGLKSAARAIGGAQIQNRGTIGGNCVTASPAADGVPCLMALDATFEVAGPTLRQVTAQDFFTGYRTTALQAGELLTGIRIPKQQGAAVFLKLGARRYLVISIAMVAAVVDLDTNHRVRAARVAVGACSATAQRLTALESDMIGKPLAPQSVQAAHLVMLKPIDDIRASADFRRHAALTLVRDAISTLAAPSMREDVHG